MAEKNINARVQHKHDVEANWLKASSFIPKQGEIIVYDVDSTHTYERIKIGDGTTVVGSLPFVNDEIRQALTSGTTKVSKAETADRATTADSATKATQDGNGQVIADTYETKADAANKLSELQTTLDTMNENLQNNIVIDLEGSNEGEANGINADTLGGNAPSHYATVSQMTKAAPRNLLDNSDFTNPVNQRGLTSYTDIGYTIDRWRTYSSGETVTVQNGYISKTGNLLQYVSGLDPNKIYTAAVCLNDGTIDVFSRVLSSGIGGWGSLLYAAYTETTGLTSFRLTSNAVDVKWVALYEGEYTAETLPEYQPKGYGVELAECQRYYRKISPDDYTVHSGLIIPIEHFGMRVIPTCTVINAVTGGQGMVVDFNSGVSYTVEIRSITANRTILAVVDGLSNSTYMLSYELSADL